MGLTSNDLLALLRAFEAGTWQEMTVVDGTDRLHVSRRPEAVVDRVTGGLASPASVPVIAPSIGIFHPTVASGQPIGSADVVGTIEVSDVVRPVPAGVHGTVCAVLVVDGEMVEYGDPVVLVNLGEGERSGPR